MLPSRDSQRTVFPARSSNLVRQNPPVRENDAALHSRLFGPPAVFSYQVIDTGEQVLLGGVEMLRMKYRESIILLPCHSLEDFPVHHEGEEAQGLLANWSALWHPVLISVTGSIPRWHRADNPPDELVDRLLVVPSVSVGQLPTGFVQRAEEAGACLVCQKCDREEILALALERLGNGAGEVDQELAADFLALGYCYLQVELLTRQMRYASNLDEVHFNNQVLAAAQAAMRGDPDEARQKLTACFDILAEERDHYYPVDAFVIDLALVATTTLGAPLRADLALPTPMNLLLSARTIIEMAVQEPQSLAALRTALARGSVGLIGGEMDEHRLPLLSCESILSELRRGRAEYEAQLGQCPRVFGRRRFGLTPALPQILHKLAFRGAIHATLDDGRFPEGMQIKTRWEGLDGSTIDALARAPLDATKPATYLNLAVKMGESMDMDHVATVCLAHWAGQSSPWLDDLRRLARRTSALGKFVTIDEYFRVTDEPGHSERFTADQYHSPYLKQAIIRRQPDPISSSVNYWRRRTAIETAQTLECLASLVCGDPGRTHSVLSNEVDQAAEEAGGDAIESRLADAVTQAIHRFAAVLPRRSGSRQHGYLVANPHTFVRRIGLEVSDLDHLPVVKRPVYAAAEAHGRKHVVVDVPPMGFAWITAGERAKSKRSRQTKPMAEDRREQDGYLVLRNEFVEVVIDATTGALRSLYEYTSRGNRLSQQLAYRRPGQRGGKGTDVTPGGPSVPYSVMAADTIHVRTDSSALGEIVAQGRLLDRDGNVLAGYEQLYRLWRGSRLVLLEIVLDPKIEPAADPWKSYFAARFAWADESSDLWRSVNGIRQPVGGKRFEAPQYVEIEHSDRKHRTTIFTGGLPFHRRQGLRMLDSVLIVRGESVRRFQLGIGIDVTHSMPHAISLLVPPTVVPQHAAPPSSANNGWLFHLDAKNVMATHWEPLVVDNAMEGFRVRLLEVAGRIARGTLSAFRRISRSQQVDFQGQPLGDCKLESGRVRFELAAGEWIEIECRWD